jgi:sarcosine oxidase gamma subunit
VSGGSAVLGFVAPAPTAPARSPIAGRAAREGARMVLRDGFEIAAELAGIDRERAWLAETVGVRDASQLRLAELEAAPSVIAQALGPDAAKPGVATRRDGAWWCRLHPGRLLVVGPTGPIPGALDVTSCLAGVRIVGPLAREAIARFCALDLRDRSAPVGALRPGSVGRTPGIVLREAQDGFLVLFGWAYSEYLWGVAIDAAQSLGGGGVGADA